MNSLLCLVCLVPDLINVNSDFLDLGRVPWDPVDALGCHVGGVAL